MSNFKNQNNDYTQDGGEKHIFLYRNLKTNKIKF
jgi:hypothetical protein